jgi:Secretion system C-terminal sorting domain
MKSFLFIVLCLLGDKMVAQIIFADNFETAQTWTITEEIVANNACYGANIGEVLRSTDFTHGGTNALRVWSNQQASLKSNHVIAAHHISTTNGISGQLRYGVWAFCKTNLGYTQSSPEVSIQSTRAVGGQNLTYIAGIQYIGNQWLTNKWNIWHNGVWQALTFAEFGITLASDTWYYLELDVDMTTNRYLSMKIKGGTVDATIDLTQAFQNAPLGFKIGAENRGWTPSLFVTAESENLWTNCTVSHENKVYYDDLILERLPNALPLEMLKMSVYTEGSSNVLIWSTANEKNVSNYEIERSFDGSTFETIGRVAAIAAANYQFIDAKKSARFEITTTLNTTYYRLKINELSDKFAYSKIIAAQTKGKSNLKIHPTIAHEYLTIDTHSTADFRVVNILGQIVLKGKTTEQIDVSALPNGRYFLSIGTEQAQFVKL